MTTRASLGFRQTVGQEGQGKVFEQKVVKEYQSCVNGRAAVEKRTWREGY